MEKKTTMERWVGRQRPPSDEVGGCPAAQLRMRGCQAASCGSGGHESLSLAVSDGKDTSRIIQHK